jgi:transcriptional regulator with GAF, ATPase, and Fis domain
MQGDAHEAEKIGQKELWEALEKNEFCLLAAADFLHVTSVIISKKLEEYGISKSEITQRGDDIERQRIAKALEETGFNKSHAASRLGMPWATLNQRMKRHGIETPPRPKLEIKVIDISSSGVTP